MWEQNIAESVQMISQQTLLWELNFANSFEEQFWIKLIFHGLRIKNDLPQVYFYTFYFTAFIMGVILTLSCAIKRWMVLHQLFIRFVCSFTLWSRKITSLLCPVCNGDKNEFIITGNSYIKRSTFICSHFIPTETDNPFTKTNYTKTAAAKLLNKKWKLPLAVHS